MKHLENLSFEPSEEESFLVEQDMAKSRALKEKSNTKEGQARMRKQLDEYAEKIKSVKTNAGLAEFVSGKKHGEFQRGLENFVQNERRIPISMRSFEEIAGEYDIDRERFKEILKGKKILDIGSGRSTFSEEAGQNNINADIVSLDINREALADSGADSGVQARGEKMPFSDEAFDLAIATYSIPYWASSAKTVDDFMDEILRVTKKNGEIYISPITDILNRPSFLKDNHSNVSCLPIERDWKAFEVLKSVQIRFIEKLEELKKEGAIDARLGKNFFHKIRRLNPEEVDNSAPTVAFIKKLK